MYQLLKAPIGKVLFLISEEHPNFKKISSGKTCIHKGSFEECETHAKEKSNTNLLNIIQWQK